MKKVLLNLVFFCALACFAEAQEFKVADIFSDTCIHQSDYVLYTYSYVSDAWSFDAGGRGEALLCASYKDEVDGACLLRDVCI